MFELPFEPTSIFFLFCLSLSLILAVIQICGIFRFHQLSHLWILKKRYPKIVIAEAVVLLVALLVAYPNLIIDEICDVLAVEHEDLCARIEYWNTYVRIATSPSFHFLSLAESTRQWLIYFDLNHLHSTLNAKWESQITSSFAANDHYIKHQRTLGNKRWLIPRVMFIWTLFTAITVSLDLCSELFALSTIVWRGSIKALVQICPMVFIGVIYCKAPTTRRAYKNSRDTLMLHYEFSATVVILFISVLGYGAAIVLTVLEFMFAGWAIVLLTLLFSMSMPSLMSTVWIPYKIQQSKQWNDMVLVEILTLDHSMFKEVPWNPRPGATKAKRGTREELKVVFRSQQKLDALVHWMRKEFNGEAILGFIEMAQFKERLIELIQRRDPQFLESKQIRNRFKFHRHIPRSSIVFHQDDHLDNLADIVRNAVAMERIEEEQESDVAEHQVPKANNSENNQSENRIPEDPMSSEIAAKMAAPLTISNLLFGAGPSGATHSNTASNSRVSVNFNGPKIMVLSLYDLERIRERMRQMFDKYIRVSSPLELNIAGSLRQSLYAMNESDYVSLSEMDMIGVYDTVLMEMLMMIEQSYRRLILSIRVDESKDRNCFICTCICCSGH